MPYGEKVFHNAGWTIRTTSGPIMGEKDMDEYRRILSAIVLPEMVFNLNRMELIHDASGTAITFNALDALAGWKHENLPPLQVRVAEEWRRAREQEIQQQKAVQLTYDWTYTTPYTCTVVPGPATGKPSTPDSGGDTDGTRMGVPDFVCGSSRTSELPTPPAAALSAAPQSVCTTAAPWLSRPPAAAVTTAAPWAMAPPGPTAPPPALSAPWATTAPRGTHPSSPVTSYSHAAAAATTVVAPAAASAVPAAVDGHDGSSGNGSASLSSSTSGGGGSGGTAVSDLCWQPTSDVIDRALLMERDPILFYDEIPLYESDLDDNGVAAMTVKLRVMPRCWLVLLRCWVRVDGLMVRLRESRIFCRHDKPDKRLEVLQEVKHCEGRFSDLRARGAPDEGPAYTDADAASQVFQAISPVGLHMLLNRKLVLPAAEPTPGREAAPQEAAQAAPGGQ